MYENYYNNLFQALCTDDMNKALDCCQSAIDIAPMHSLGYILLILFLIKSNNIEKAKEVYDKFNKINPNFQFEISPEIEMPLAVFVLKHFVSIETPFINEGYEHLLNTTCPSEADFIRVVIQYIGINDISNSFKMTNKALEKYPNSVSLNYNKSAILMKSERLEEAWDYYELREKIYNHHKLLLPNVPKYPYLKENVKLLVYAAAGFGDTIFYARYLKLLQEKNIDLYIYVQPQLKELFKLNGFNVIDNLDEMKFDYQISFMSLGWLFKTSLDTIPQADKYLLCPKMPTNSKLKTGLRKVGLVWKSGAQSNRRLTIEQLAPVLSLPNYQFYSLQKEIDEQEKQLLSQYNIIDLSDDLTSFVETSNFINQMDFIIGCDTAVTNLSAALGKETLVLVPFFCDFRWSITEFFTPWYNSARVFRQDLPDNWDFAINNLSKYLQG